MFAARFQVKHPEVIMPAQKSTGTSTSYEVTTLNGTYYRVSPQTSREIMALQMLEHHVDKFSPAHGDGVILTPEALRKFS